MDGLHIAGSRLSSEDPMLPETAEGEGEEVAEYEDEVEAESDVDEVFDRQAFGIYQQLPVARGKPDLNGEPQTAEEYLQRVR